MILIKKFASMHPSILYRCFSTSHTSQLVKTMKDFVQGNTQNIDINLILNNYPELDDKLLVDSTLHKYINNKGLDSKLAERIKDQLVFTDSWKNRNAIMKIIVNYYGLTQKNVTALFESTNWDRPDIKFKTLKILQQIDLNGNLLIEKGLIELLKNQTNKLFICLICYLLSRIRPQNGQYIQQINQIAEKLTISDQRLIKEFFLIKNFSNQFPNRTIKLFADGLANIIGDYEGQQMLAILTNIYDIGSKREKIFVNFLENLERIFLKNDIHMELLYKYLKICTKYNIRLKELATDIVNNPNKYLKIFGKKLNNQLIIDILIREKLSIPQIFIDQIKKYLLQYLSEPDTSNPQFQQSFNKKIVLLFKVIKKFEPSQQTKIRNYIFKIVENVYLDKQNLKMVLIVGANMNDNSLIQYTIRKLDPMTLRSDYSIIINVWYNIIRLNLSINFSLTIRDIQDFTKFTEPEVNYVLYISVKSVTNLNEKKIILDKLESTIEDMCNHHRLYLKTLFLVIRQYSDCPTQNKFFYVHLQSNLMAEFNKMRNIQQKDVKYVLNYFKKINRGSKKFYTFMNDILKKTENNQNVKKEYYSREKKFQQLRQKQRVDKVRNLQQFEAKKPYKK